MKPFRLLYSLGFALLLALPASAKQGPDENDPPAENDQPTELGIRLTPGMARGMARTITRELLVRHYEMDEAKVPEMTEILARRLMKVAHANEEKAQETIEWAATEWVRYAAERPEAEQEGVPKALGQGLGQRLLPLMPVARELLDGAVSDIRPMLPIKGQLKLAGELTVAKMGMDAFEKNMEKWSKGDVDPFANPFDPNDNREVKKDAEGLSRQFREAKNSAESQSRQPPGAEWRYYLDEAKKYYAFDASQIAAGESLFRDFQQRALVVIGSDPDWKSKSYRNRLWGMLVWQLPGRWDNPIRIFVDRNTKKATAPLQELGEEFKQRVDELATQAQRDAAEKRIDDALLAKGVDVAAILTAQAKLPSRAEGQP